MTQTELEALCARWQKILRLQDWDIKPKLVRHHELGEDRLGRCYWKLTKRTAAILVLDPVDYDPDTEWAYDPEQTLVHEMLHLAFAPFDADESSPQGVAQEQVIEAISRALVALARGGDAPSAAASKVVNLAEWRAQRESNVQGPFICKLA